MKKTPATPDKLPMFNKGELFIKGTYIRKCVERGASTAQAITMFNTALSNGSIIEFGYCGLYPKFKIYKTK